MQLNINKAKKYLKWKPTYNIKDRVKITTEWYLRVLRKKERDEKVTKDKIIKYIKDNIIIFGINKNGKCIEMSEPMIAGEIIRVRMKAL